MEMWHVAAREGQASAWVVLSLRTILRLNPLSFTQAYMFWTGVMQILQLHFTISFVYTHSLPVCVYKRKFTLVIAQHWCVIDNMYYLHFQPEKREVRKRHRTDSAAQRD